jgi:hypothetical protein
MKALLEPDFGPVSMGGIVGAEACRTEPRLRACLFLDSRMPARVVGEGLPQPAMWLTRDAGSMQRAGQAPLRTGQRAGRVAEPPHGAARVANHSTSRPRRVSGAPAISRGRASL